MVSAREVRRLLEERPEMEAGFRELRAAEEPFEFHDLAMDSGTFGELVATPFVTEAERGDGYELVDREAIDRALNGDVPEPATGGSPRQSFSVPDFDRTRVVLLSGALLFVALMRTVFSFSNVFHANRVVLSANDPYYYRYLVEELLANPDLTLHTLPRGVRLGEPLYVVSMWLVSNLLGGSDAVVGWVLAWYPVVSAVITGFLLYVLVIQVTEDRRIALAAVILLAVLPGHAMRTSLGFADHHAFDYPWLALTAVSLLALVRTNSTRSRRLWAGMTGLGLGIAGQVLAWEAGPLLITPVGLIIGFASLIWVSRGQSPARNGAPIAFGLGMAAILVWVVHTTLDWHTTLVASSPSFLFLGVAALLGIAELAFRFDYSPLVAGIAEGGVAIAGIVAFGTFFPEFWNSTMARVTGSLFRTDAIAETQSLFGDSVAWLLLFGFILVLALPYLAWASWHQRRDVRWAIPVGYGWALLSLSVIQIRFVGEFGFIAAFFAAVGFVHIAERVDLARLPKPFDSAVDGSVIHLPDRRNLTMLFVLFLLVGGLSILQVPVKTSQVTTPTEASNAAAWMANYSAEHDMEYPENYVLSQWGTNRMYNYFVNGEPRSYGYARNTYGEFLLSTNSTKWHERIQDRVGFIVTTDLTFSENLPQELNYVKLHEENARPLDGYELVYTSESSRYKVFRVVEEG